jgi:hypothetical protein
MDQSLRSHYAEIDAAREASYRAQMTEARKQGDTAQRICIDAAMSARVSAKADHLFPRRDEDGDEWYSEQQGFKAACLGREDAAATLTLQLPQLRLLYQVRAIGLCCLGLLAYIAYRVA